MGTLEDRQPRLVVEAANETVSIQPEECDLHAVHELCVEVGDGATAGFLRTGSISPSAADGLSPKPHAIDLALKD